MSDVRCPALILALLAASGCAAPSVDEEPVAVGEAALGETTTLRFDADFEERLASPLSRGQKLRVVYDPARLASCRGQQGGVPQWSLTGFYRIGSGPVRSFPVAGLNAPAEAPVIELPRAGELRLWFQANDRWGCNAFDSDFGRDYRFTIAPAASDPSWIGNARYAIDRMTCEGGPCEGSLRPVPAEILYDTWARQRAAVRAMVFEVWKQGLTDHDDAELWKKLDVQVHTRVAGAANAAFTSRYVRFDRRAGDNARFTIDLGAIDPLASLVGVTDRKDCPVFPMRAQDGVVEATVELYVTVNGVELRPAATEDAVYRVRYQNYAGSFGPCVAP